MKPRGRTVKEFNVNLFRLLLLTIVSSFLTVHVTAQTFTTLHAFASYQNNTNSDGIYPEATLALSGSTLYGTTVYGGSLSNGTIFRINVDGTGFAVMHNFAGFPGDGGRSMNPLLLSGAVLYGTAGFGMFHAGTVFAINTDGTGYTNLHHFTGGSGGFGPFGALVVSGNTLYGATSSGGSSGNGTLFKLNTDGTGFKILYNFTAFTAPDYTNSDGVNPNGGLVLSGTRLYGTAYRGGLSTYGTVFALNVDGTDFTSIHNFSGFSYGANPNASLILAGDTLYSTTQIGGSSGGGSVFAIKTNGTSFTLLHEFTATSGSRSTNSDGSGPVGGLILSGNTLYGVAIGGGEWAGGTVFELSADGDSFVTLHSFTFGSDGAFPYGGVIFSDNMLYGTVQSGGTLGGKGTVFSLSLVHPPQLTLTRSAGSVILAWPTNYTGFSLQSATNLLSPVWTTNLPAPVVLNGQNTVTNPISGTQQFFRLSH